MPEPRRFPPPWTVEELTESFVVRDGTGFALAYADQTEADHALLVEAVRTGRVVATPGL